MSSNESQHHDILAIFVDPSKIEQDEEFFDYHDDRGADLPKHPVSTDSWIHSEKLHMGKSAGASPVERCNKCEHCVLPDCTQKTDQNDLLCGSE